MKKYLSTCLLSGVFLILTQAAIAQTIACDSSLWNHVYASYRLHVNQQCMTVTGTIDHLQQELDGDIHIRMFLDSGQTTLLNSYNISNQNGCMVLEPVCAAQVYQPNAFSACSSYSNNVYIPNVGDHVEVTGSFVTDNSPLHGWNEIHPVTNITLLTVTSVNKNTAPDFSTISIFPVPASDFLNFRFGDLAAKISSLCIYNSLGQQLLNYTISGEKTFIAHVNELENGIYFYDIKSGKQIVKTGKLVVLKQEEE
jgi:hypothetical protein